MAGTSLVTVTYGMKSCMLRWGEINIRGRNSAPSCLICMLLRLSSVIAFTFCRRPVSHLLSRMASTKTIAVLDASELKDGQMKQVDFEDGKVLLAQIGNKVHATSAFCTHYGVCHSKHRLHNTYRCFLRPLLPKGCLLRTEGSYG